MPPTPDPPFVWVTLVAESLATHDHVTYRARLASGWLYRWSCHCHDPSRVSGATVPPSDNRVLGATAAAMVYVPDK